ncbi:Uncharacterised protein [Escherichia coli]|uniref:hypothetical protein n=1 Tax=Escherichia coli TaxID=562 RepID=UPI000BE7F718|nr:hypothetical protein [Escherichia coli]EFE2809469.1 hypothetical protein [Escherichia coli]UMT09752.1 hypothetical protein AOY62_15080 [Escherichia coli]CAD5752745.1 Uncharacterised protein [Escherichia coli]CAD6112501.1 Uncharacterised protein [Escherichia coli]CAD6530446.1 Uncharacterised protein [Escherichia coli]
MFRNSDELELARSCVPIIEKSVKKKFNGVSNAGFNREEAIKLAKEFYSQGTGHSKEFFKKHHTCLEMFHRTVRLFELDIKRYFRIDGGPIYSMKWITPKEVKKRPTRGSRAHIFKIRGIALTKEYKESRELFVELANVYYSHYYKQPKAFYEVLRKVDISWTTFRQRIRKYGIKAEFFMSIDNGDLFPIKFGRH